MLLPQYSTRKPFSSRGVERRVQECLEGIVRDDPSFERHLPIIYTLCQMIEARKPIREGSDPLKVYLRVCRLVDRGLGTYSRLLHRVSTPF